ncbi:Uncharacterised protein [Mycobacterium tuberculosis]|nr:Uncharacterised protein [Mycobacterium tuberculosis]
MEASPPVAATRRVDDDDRVAGHRMQHIGAAQVSFHSQGGQVVARHGQPHRVDIAADRPDS